MHEVGIMQETLRLAEQQARTAGASQVHKLRLRVGQMSGVVQESLEYAFEVLRSGTLAETAALEIEPIPATCWCATCQAEFPSPDLAYECPRCGQLSGELRRGRELELVSLEIS
jgi:hydrogenase nickel incorporation protein HypA/HybF